MSKIDAVTAYNKALHSIKLDNVDLAVMSLKKALELIHHLLMQIF